MTTTPDSNSNTAVSSGIQIVGLYHGSGTHYVHLWCGGGDGPPQRQTMIVDTGSSTTALACAPDCSPRRCGRLHHAPFHPARSSTFRKVSQCSDCRLGTCVTNAAGSSECVWHTSYQEGSNWTAFEAVDRCYLGSWSTSAAQEPMKAVTEEDTRDTALSITNRDLDPNRAALDFSFDLRFGCQTQLSGLFRTQATAGIMGLDRAGTAAAVWSQMFQQYKIALPAFSLCLARPAHEQAFAGALTLGGTDDRLHAGGDHQGTTSMVYAAMNPEGRSSGYFAVQLRQLYLRFHHTRVTVQTNAKTIPIHPSSGNTFHKRRIVIDSGTTDTFFVQELKEPFIQAWTETLGLHYSNDPIALSDTALNSLPTIILQLKGDDASNTEVFNSFPTSLQLASSLDPDRPLDILVEVPPSHYMEYQEDTAMYMSRIYFEEAESSVIGSNVMLMHDVFFDVEHERIGWTKSSCDYAKLISSFVKDTDNAFLVERPLVKISDTAVLSWKYMSWSPFVSGFCDSTTCRLSLIAGLILSFLVVLTVASHRGRRRKRRQRRQLAPPPMQRNVSRVVSRSTSHVVAMGPNKMAPGRSPSPSVVAVFMSSVMNTRHPSVSTSSSETDHLLVPSGFTDENLATDFMVNGFRRGALLRSRSRDVASL